jgi:anthranilate synthase component 1
MSRPNKGGAAALQRRLPARTDPLALYAALTDGGRRKDTLLLEQASGPTLLMDRAAVRIECRGGDVKIVALSSNGGLALKLVCERLARRVVHSDASEALLRFPRHEGCDAEARLLAPSPLDVLRELTTGFDSLSPEEPFAILCLGIAAFDHVDLFEDLPSAREDPLDFPDFLFWLAESLIVFEDKADPRLVCTAIGSDDAEAAQRSYFDASSRLADLYARCGKAREHPVAEPTPAPPATIETGLETDLDDAAFRDLVVRLREHIAAGEIYQIVPSRTFRAPCHDPIAAYGAIRALDPSPYHFFVAAPEHFLFGASPETSVRVFRQEGWKNVEVKPIAGTRPRGTAGDEDDRLEAEMRLDHKELAEHMMLVDLARNDVARISVPGTRRVARLMSVERYARVMHLVSSVTGVLGFGFDAFHALQACLNVGTLTGAPKHRATQLLRENELTKRGPYGGAIGWVSGAGLMDSAVIIRSAVVRDGTAFVRAGAGVVYDSDPQFEADETRRKASALLSVLASSGGVQ